MSALEVLTVEAEEHLASADERRRRWLSPGFGASPITLQRAGQQPY
jgi:hypothetical protein